MEKREYKSSPQQKARVFRRRKGEVRRWLCMMRSCMKQQPPRIYMTASSSVRTWSEVVRKSEGRFLCNDIANLRVISNYARVCWSWCFRLIEQMLLMLPPLPAFIPSSRGEWLSREKKKSLIFVKCFNTLLILLNGNRNFHRHALENFLCYYQTNI